MELQDYLGIGSIVIVLLVVLYKRLTRGETLKDIYKRLDDESKSGPL